MTRRAIALHLVEKGLHPENLREIAGSPGEWSSGRWVIGDQTAEQLKGCRIYLHEGQKKPSHAGGEILSSHPAPGTDPKRKVFHFRALPDCIGHEAPRSGWGNEKCIVWSEE